MSTTNQQTLEDNHDPTDNNQQQQSNTPKKEGLTVKSFPDKYGNSGPLGLLAFGIATLMLSFSNVNVYPIDTVVQMMCFFYGGICQFTMGIIELKKGRTFTATAYCSYGIFWVSQVLIWRLGGADKNAEGTYLLLWAAMTLVMSFGTLKGHFTIIVVFFSLFATFFILSVAAYTGKEAATRVGGAFGLLCGGFACYASLAEVICSSLGYTKVPE